jgi:pimeloyl-ACP methyl ester carboxylesterase
MITRDDRVEISVGEQRIAGTLVSPATLIPGMLFVHGWGGSQEQYLARAREMTALGCICLTFDLRGHALDEPRRESVTREDNLCDVLAAYDLLVSQRQVDPTAIAIVGSSYGGYLAALLTSMRPVRWLGLRAPALYRDEDWLIAKRQLDRNDLAAYRSRRVQIAENRALAACAAFRGDVLVVESEHDDIVPHPTSASYIAAFEHARSITHRVIDGADHGLSEPEHQQEYTSLLVRGRAESRHRQRHRTKCRWLSSRQVRKCSRKRSEPSETLLPIHAG